LQYSIRILSVLFLLLTTVPCLHANELQDDENRHFLGIYLSDADYSTLTSNHLQLLDQMGISILEFEGHAPQRVINLIDELDFQLFITQPRRFVTSPILQENDSLYFQEDLSLIRDYRNSIVNKVAAFGLFIYPDETSAINLNLLNQYVSRFADSDENELLLYYRTAFPELQNYPGSFSFRSTHIAAANAVQIPTQVIHFIPSDNSTESLNELKYVLDLSLERDQSIVLLPYSWLFYQLEQFDLLSHALTTFSQDQTLLFPEPEPETPAPSPNWIVIFFIVLLGTYIAHYHSSPLYQRSLLRYFTMHKFFIDDVMEYRIRTSISASILFAQHILVTGLFCFILANTFLSSLGMEALYHFFPFLNLFGSGSLGVALFCTFAAALVQLVSVSWIHFINDKSRFVQAVTLYSWPLQINFPVLLIMTAVYQAGASDNWIVLFSILFIAICIFSFITASLDIASYLIKFRIVYILFTVGLYVAIVIMFITMILLYPPLSAPIRFVFALP
jgi:hypothetical protein